MNGKVLAIGILVLLLCAMLPMAVTAAPAATTSGETVTAKVYLGHIDSSTPWGKWVLSTKPVGTLTINTKTHEWSLTANNVPSGNRELLMTNSPDSLATLRLTIIVVSENGRVNANGKIGPVEAITVRLERGSSVFFDTT